MENNPPYEFVTPDSPFTRRTGDAIKRSYFDIASLIRTNIKIVIYN
jgi:hypothetical protein